MQTPVPQTLAGLGWVAGTPLTLVQFSSAFCAPCRATRALCERAAATVPGVAHVEVDAESHLSAVRELDITRTPTVLLVDAEGRIVRRASGQPTRSQLLSAVAGVAL
jgi:thiol-disulfide isomerase/thioredoxin